jgi:hypothetical protein
VSELFRNPLPILESVQAPPVCAFHLSESTLSHDQIRDALRAALCAGKGDNYYCWPREVFDDYVIYEIEAPTGQALYRRGYTIDGDGNVTLGDEQPVRVETKYVPVTEAVRDRLQGGALLESLDTEGWKWRIQVIAAGRSANGNEYPLNVLHEAVNAYAGVPAFYGRGVDHNPNERGFDSIAGYVTDPAPNPRGIEATLEINRGKPEMREAFMHGYDVAQRTGRSPFGFSHVVPAGGAIVEAIKPRGYRVKAITQVSSVDVVVTPAAGGALLNPLSESQDSFVPDPLQEAIVNVAELLARYRAGNRLTQDEWKFLQESLPADEFSALLTEAIPTKPVETPAEPATPNTAPLDEATRRIEEAAAAAERRFQLAECKATLAELLAESKLPQKFQDAIRADFKERIFESADLEARIGRDKELFAEAAAVKPHGLGAVVVTEDQREKHQKAMDGLVWGRTIDGVKPFLTLKEAYQAVSGDYRDSYIDGILAQRVLQEARTFTGDDRLLAESVTTTTFGDVLGDSIRRRMLQEYARPDRQTWRQIVTTTPVVDFRTVERTRWGGYDFLPVVGEGAPYQPLDTPGDEKATDSLDKRGGLEDLTLEAIANDDMGLVRRIPVKLGYAAVDTLYNEVWNVTIKDNATASYDTTALYHNNHANTGTTAFDNAGAGLLAVETAMRDQLDYGNQTGLPLGEANMPRILAIPNELRVVAYQAVTGMTPGGATVPNMFQGRYEVIVVDSWTDATDWYAFADPSLNPVLEVGFYQGREEPELFVQDAANVGSMFTADKVTWKIRHIWYVMIIDHRGTYRMVVAN